MDCGLHHEKTYSGPRVANFREWTELFRRLTIPYYDQARLAWPKAEAGGYFEGVDEISIYTEGILKDLIRKYGSHHALPDGLERY